MIATFKLWLLKTIISFYEWACIYLNNYKGLYLLCPSVYIADNGLIMHNCKWISYECLFRSNVADMLIYKYTDLHFLEHVIIVALHDNTVLHIAPKDIKYVIDLISDDEDTYKAGLSRVQKLNTWVW